MSDKRQVGQPTSLSLWLWFKHVTHLLQRPFDSHLQVDGNRLATFLNYVSTVVCVWESSTLIICFPL